MLNRLLGVLALSIVVGLVVALVAGPSAGTGAFAAAGVIGAIVVVLWRNHRDRTELERALVPVPIRRVVRDDVPMRERSRPAGTARHSAAALDDDLTWPADYEGRRR